MFLDDIVILSKTPQENVTYTAIISSLPKEAGVALKLYKCPFFTNYIC